VAGVDADAATLKAHPALPAQLKISRILFAASRASYAAGMDCRPFELFDDRISALEIGEVLDPHLRISFTKWNITQPALRIFLEHARGDAGMAQQARHKMRLRQISGLVDANQVFLAP